MIFELLSKYSDYFRLLNAYLFVASQLLMILMVMQYYGYLMIILMVIEENEQFFKERFLFQPPTFAGKRMSWIYSLGDRGSSNV